MASIKMNNSIKFMENIEDLVQRTRMSYIDAVIHYCEENHNHFKTTFSLCICCNILYIKPF